MNPFGTRTAYNDNILDRFCINIFCQKIAAKLGGGKAGFVPESPTFDDDVVRLSQEIMRGRSSKDQRELIREILLSFLPRGIPQLFKLVFPPSKFSAEFNALIASVACKWLVGDMEIQEADVQVSPTEFRTQSSVVHIKKCRYLEASGCVGMCVNMCKMPTQSFFTNEMGLPLTMNPNFETLSCDMIFGQTPVPLSQDAVYTQPCFPVHCSVASAEASRPCPKMDSDRPSSHVSPRATAAAAAMAALAAESAAGLGAGGMV
ncbi:MAG: hypothetical protein WDW38_007622 [Sanguina aurantia]